MTSLNHYFKKYEKQIILKEIGFSGQKKRLLNSQGKKKDFQGQKKRFSC